MNTVIFDTKMNNMSPLVGHRLLHAENIYVLVCSSTT